ncbi:ferredoxin--NADP+ reductase [Tangfeifania diversioriginum]|uniref:Ferredoxin--NADP+ reductase n=1 Tax=Tangfeifania diversioriginum TaxID=1168035 RepID=A0A1M6HR56_9BACT|nr:FAD-dependent oxidoreductase [Tangfeifania diversioriginum]SHJ24679.1 ferredoxin--NADP+ reductase [Tangfeifania diversioriginum]
MKAYELTNNEEISPGVHVISFKRDFEFIPGQVVKIALSPGQVPRIYSICSGNTDDEVRILFNIKEGGELTPRLASLIPGEKVFVSEPYGNFSDTKAPAWWIATGTGIAPFYSMYRSGLAENKTLIHGVRWLNQFYFEDEWEQALDENYVRCCSGESSCDTFPGRVTDYLKQLNQSPDVNFFICGKALMVVEVRDLLIEKGIPFNNIFSEIYF